VSAGATIRPAQVEDLPAIYRLGLRCYDVRDKPYNYWSVREVADHLEQESALCFVAEEDGVVAGFVLGAETYEILKDTGHLEWIAVAPEHRRGGLAVRLIETFLDALRACGRKDVVADVSTANQASRGLFDRAGFSEGISVTFFVRPL
jgi:ribosomal protein S18 acetylase RimI-like enzyme